MYCCINYVKLHENGGRQKIALNNAKKSDAIAAAQRALVIRLEAELDRIEDACTYGIFPHRSTNLRRKAVPRGPAARRRATRTDLCRILQDSL